MSRGPEELRKDIRVLIVDEVGKAVETLQAVVEALGFTNVVTSSDGSEALERVERGEVELLIADWSVPELSGVELLKAVRASQSAADLPVVMTASEQEREHLLEAICAGASSLLVVNGDAASLKESLRLRLESVFGIDPNRVRATKGPS